MTHWNGIPKRQAGRRLVALAAAIGLFSASLLMPPTMAAVSGGMMPSPAPRTEMQAGHDHAGHSHAAQGRAAQGHADRQDHDGQMSQSDSSDRSGNSSDDPSGCGLCSDCTLCTMAVPMTVGAIPAAEYPPARLCIADSSLLPGIAPPPPAEPPRV